MAHVDLSNFSQYNCCKTQFISQKKRSLEWKIFSSMRGTNVDSFLTDLKSRIDRLTQTLCNNRYINDTSTINTNLEWGSHWGRLINKCNRTKGMIKLPVCFNAPAHATTSLYRTLVQSNLEYCSSVWSPSTVSDTEAIESIQRAATRYIPNCPENNYEQRCTILHYAWKLLDRAS